MSINRYHRNCHCNNCLNNTMPEVLEDICEDVQEECMCNPKLSKDECSCGFDETVEDLGLPLNPILAQAYVPIQRMDKTFIPSVGLKMGTIFPELVRPYMPNQSMRIRELIESQNVIGEGCNYGM